MVNVSFPRPNDVRAFKNAATKGWLPVVPEVAPPLVPGVTARRAFLDFGGFTVAGFVGVVLAFTVFGDFGPVSGAIVVAAYVFVVVRMGNRYILAALREMLAGYHTTSVPTYGSFAWDRDRRWSLTSGAAWNGNGLWFLDGQGVVVREPDRGLLPPGWYPSPNLPDRMEFWTGAQWCYRYRPLLNTSEGSAHPLGRFWTPRSQRSTHRS